MRKVYRFKVMAKCMTIDEFHRLPEEVQDKYLTWSMQQFLRERKAILIERAGGVAVIARQLANARVMNLEYYMMGNYKSLRLRTSKRNSPFVLEEMFSNTGFSVLTY